MKKLSVVSWIILLAALGAATLPRADAATFVVPIGSYFFRPTNLVINVNDSVLWTNQATVLHDSTQGTATTPAGSRLWASPALAQNQKFTFTFSNAGFYPYLCKIHVIDNGGLQPQQTGTVSVITGNLPPTINITNPPNNARFTNAASIAIFASAADTNGAVDHVDFLVNGRLAGTDANAPYSAVARHLVFGTNVLTAIVTDNLGLTKTSAPVNVIATNFATTNIIRVQNFTFNPTNITIAAGSSLIWSNLDGFDHTATGDATSLEPLCGPSVNLSSTRLCTNRFMTPGVYPYFCSIHPEMRGTVVVVNAASTPLVNLTNPLPGSVFMIDSAITFQATASDTNGIVRVEFFHSGNAPIGTDATAPYEVSTDLPAGVYSVFAHAIDSFGFGALSPEIPITVAASTEFRLVSPTLTNGLFEFDLITTAGMTYVVEQSPTVTGAWLPFTTNVAAGPLLHLSDPVPVNTVTQRFYRAFIKP